MANDALSSIRANLATQLGEVSELQAVQDERSFDFSGFPACRFYLVSVESEMVSNAPMYLRKYRFQIDIFQETTKKSKSAAENDLQNAIDAVLDKLGTEWQLDDNVDNSRVESGAIEEIDGTQGPMIAVAITFEAQTFIS